MLCDDNKNGCFLTLAEIFLLPFIITLGFVTDFIIRYHFPNVLRIIINSKSSFKHHSWSDYIEGSFKCSVMIDELYKIVAFELRLSSIGDRSYDK